MKKFILATALIAGFATPLHSAPFDPSSCGAGSTGFCLDYLNAFMAGYEARKTEAEKRASPICIPQEEPWEKTLPKFKQEYEKAVKYLGFQPREAPEEMRRPIYGAMTWMALSEAYPCK